MRDMCLQPPVILPNPRLVAAGTTVHTRLRGSIPRAAVGVGFTFREKRDGA